MNRIFALMAVVLLSASALAHADLKTTNELEVRKTLAAFVRAFDDLDWEAFRAAFADDATVFYPRAFPQRAEGRLEFERNFRQVFEQIRGGRTTGPYINLQPRNLQIQMAGDVAIVTFHLDDKAGFVNRRTLVLRRFKGIWRIIHLHASEVANPAP